MASSVSDKFDSSEEWRDKSRTPGNLRERNSSTSEIERPEELTLITDRVCSELSESPSIARTGPPLGFRRVLALPGTAWDGDGLRSGGGGAVVERERLGDGGWCSCF